MRPRIQPCVDRLRFNGQPTRGDHAALPLAPIRFTRIADPWGIADLFVGGSTTDRLRNARVHEQSSVKVHVDFQGRSWMSGNFRFSFLEALVREIRASGYLVWR